MRRVEKQILGFLLMNFGLLGYWGFWNEWLVFEPSFNSDLVWFFTMGAGIVMIFMNISFSGLTTSHSSHSRARERDWSTVPNQPPEYRCPYCGFAESELKDMGVFNYFPKEKQIMGPAPGGRLMLKMADVCPYCGAIKKEN